jgi:hypothetical protein
MGAGSTEALIGKHKKEQRKKEIIPFVNIAGLLEMMFTILSRIDISLKVNS